MTSNFIPVNEPLLAGNELNYLTSVLNPDGFLLKVLLLKSLKISSLRS